MGFAVATLALSLVLSAGAGASGFTVAIDPGHGGSNRGAPTKRPDYFEKHLTLALAKRVQRILAVEKNLKVVLCRNTDALLPIRARVRCGNQAGARLFISLHANAAGPMEEPGSQRGFELFVLPVGEVDKEVARVALLAPEDSEAAWAGHQVRTAAAQSLAAARRYGEALLQTRSQRQRQALLDELFATLATDLVPERPGRREPRAVKRRPKPYPLLTCHRHKFREIKHRDNRYRKKKTFRKTVRIQGPN